MTIHQTSFILKVLNGANAGAAVRLKTGSSIIGHSISSDIILHDEEIADHHVQLTISADSISLKPLAQPVLVDGHEVGVAEIGLQPRQVVRLGNVEFVIVDSLAANDRRTAPPRARSGAETASMERATVQGAVPTATRPGAGSPGQVGRKGRQGGSVPYLGIGLGLLLLGNLIYFAPKLSGLMESAGIGKTDEQKAEVLMAKLGQNDFDLKEQPDGSLKLRGYVDTVDQRNALMKEIQQAGLKANVSIWSQEELVDNAAMICKTLGESGVRVKGLEHGNLLADGFVSSDDAWGRVKANIMSDITGIRAVSDQNIQTLERFKATFAQFIGEKGLSSRVTLSTGENEVIVKGELTKQEIAQLTTLREEFIKSYDGDTPDILFKVGDVKDRIKLSIRSVSVGKVPFIVSKDGKKFQEGANLGENYFIKLIKPDYIMLTNNGVDIPFYYGIEEQKSDVAD